MLLSRRALPTQLRTTWRAGYPARIQRRWFTPRHCRTVLLEGGENMTEEVFLWSVPQAVAKTENNNKPLVVLLSTPALSSRLISPSGPTSSLQALLSRIFGRSLKHQFGASISAIRVVSAVVDALPAPRAGHIAEGFSYMILTSGGEHDLAVVPDQADQDENGTLEFKFSDEWHQDIPALKAKPSWGVTDYRVAIRLANTLFLSGRKKTLLDATYLVDPFGDLHLARDEWLAHCSIPYHPREHRFLNNFDERVSKTDKRLNLSLVPLTEPRKISGSLGNILRTVELPDGSQRPASHELEANLESYFKTTKQQPHPRPVWALLMDESGVERSRLVFHNAKFIDALSGEPSQRSGLEMMWSKPDLEASDEYNLPLHESVVLDGAKLRRVLSGGGGWGDKAGLLALDPHDLIQAPRKNEEEISQFSSDNSDHTHVQFFTSTNSPAPQLFQYHQGFHMGVVPDGTPKWVPTSLRTRHQDVYPMSFMALSYGGMSFSTNTSINEANFPTLQEHPKETTRTQVDVPFASFTYVRPDPASKLDRTGIRPSEVLEAGRSVLATGDKILRYVCETSWEVLRESSIALNHNAKVDLRTRRDQIKPVLDSIIQILTTVKPGAVALVSQGISRFNALVDTPQEERRLKEYEKMRNKDLTEFGMTRKEIITTVNSTDSFIDQVATGISNALRSSQEHARWVHNFDLGASQRSLAAVYTDLIRIIGEAKPVLLDRHHRAMRRTMSIVVSHRILYYHDEWHKTRGIIRKARTQIDSSKRALGVPITHYEGTKGADAESVASELRGLLGRESEGQSEQNLSEMKQSRPRSRP